jgi:hypothetical protein
MTVTGRAAATHRKDMREAMITLLCRPREIDSRRELVAMQALAGHVTSVTDVVLSRSTLTFLDKFCKDLGVVNEPVIFQTEEDFKAKRSSILGKGVHPAETAMWWIVGEMLFVLLQLTNYRLANMAAFCRKSCILFE